ncbi:MAG: D-2-hydroxyacid dehydrogenase [Ruminococcaceae bacterium]|nr:D-2-hydroxyacid dehydrogenase [Oscillospiraceae bacterium]
MKIVMTDCQTITKGDLDLSAFDALGEVVIYDLTPKEKIYERIKDADAVICNKTVLNEENLKGTNVKYIGLFATGYNNIDTEYCKNNGITVCNAGSYSTEAVAQHTFAFILNYFNKIADYTNFVKDGGWKASETFSPFVFPLSELKGKTIGIIGFGKIGQEVAKIAKAFSMNVKVYTRTKREMEGADFVSFDELISTSDIVTVHCPLNKQSEKMFTKEVFEKFKSDALFINTARGGVMVEQDLIDALNDEIIGGAGIDVLEEEPMNVNSKLPEAKNIMITPHIAWAPIETRNRVVAVASGNLKNYIEGNPTNVVNL